MALGSVIVPAPTDYLPLTGGTITGNLTVDGEISGNLSQQLITQIMLLAHPVKSYYASDDPTDPGKLFGGTWERVAQDRALMGASAAHPAGSTAEAGLPNVTGKITSRTVNLEVDQIITVSGKHADADSALYATDPTTWADKEHYVYNGEMKTTAGKQDILLDASRTNSIYGRSDTVQPPAHYTYIWRRIA